MEPCNSNLQAEMGVCYFWAELFLSPWHGQFSRYTTDLRTSVTVLIRAFCQARMGVLWCEQPRELCISSPWESGVVVAAAWLSPSWRIQQCLQHNSKSECFLLSKYILKELGIKEEGRGRGKEWKEMSRWRTTNTWQMSHASLFELPEQVAKSDHGPLSWWDSM